MMIAIQRDPHIRQGLAEQAEPGLRGSWPVATIGFRQRLICQLLPTQGLRGLGSGGAIAQGLICNLGTVCMHTLMGEAVGTNASGGGQIWQVGSSA